jgi:hypothetical protein
MCHKLPCALPQVTIGYSITFGASSREYSPLAGRDFSP